MRDPRAQAVIPIPQILRAARTDRISGGQVVDELERAGAISPERSPGGRPDVTVPDYLTLWDALWKRRARRSRG